MRMHPRRFGSYNLAARTASFIVNEKYKKKKGSPNDGTGCGTVIIVILFVLFILNACSRL